MQELEKILEELKKVFEQNIVKELNGDGTVNKYSLNPWHTWNDIEEAMRKHSVWIPVEERLPEDYSQVMVSMYDLGWITIGTYSSHSKLWKVNSYITGLGVDVRAWCPLPDPYRLVTKP